MTGAAWGGFDIDPIAVSGAASDIRRRREASETRRVDVQSMVRAWIEDGGHRSWLEGQTGLTVDAQHVKALRAKIDLAYRGSDRQWATNYLVRGLERGRLQCGWNVKVPPHVLTLRLPSPQLNADTFVGLTKSTDIEQAILAYWNQCARSAAPVTQEMIIISAIWHSALIDRKRINAVDEQLRAGAVRVTADGQWAWVDWQDAPGNWQRHVFDPYTTLLILRWLDDRVGGPDNSVEATPEDREFPSLRLSLRVWRTLRSKLGSEAFGVRCWSDFLGAAQAKWHYVLPPALAHYAHGKINTASLPPHACWRVLLGKRLAPQPDERAEDGEESPASFVADGKGKRGRAPGQGARAQPAGRNGEVRALMLGDNRRAGVVLVALRRYREQLSDSRKLDWILCDWMIALMRPSGRTGNRLSSARELLTRVDRRLDAVLGSTLPDDPSIWNDSIEAIIQCAPQSSRGNIRTALAMLDAHVRSVRCWEPPEADLGRDEGSVVDAQVVTEREFQDVMQELRAQAVSRECEVAAILGYRCGLRRTEIRGLRLIDFQSRVEPLLFVRSHAGRALKRDSGRRVLQLKSLCTEEELGLLYAQADASERMAQASPIARDLVLLLPQASDLSAPLPEESLLGPVQDVLRQICGEGAIRFHHLRHSAANRTLCDLIEAAVPGASHLLDPEGLSRDIASLRHRALVGAGQSLRPLVWATSALLGHVTPQTTLGSYVHVLDMLLGHATRREAMALRIPSMTLAWLGKTSASSIDVLRHGLKSSAASPTPQLLVSVLIARHVTKLSQRFPLSCPWPAESLKKGSRRSIVAAENAASKRLRNIAEALRLIHALWKDPQAPEALRFAGQATCRVIAEQTRRWSSLRGPSLARRAISGYIDGTIRVGALALERPRKHQLLQSKGLQREAQSFLVAWRAWHSEDPVAVEQVLTVHWARHDADDHAIVFTDIEEARLWLNAVGRLNSLGAPLPFNALQWLHMPNARGTDSAIIQRNAWLKELQIDGVTVADASPRRFTRAKPAPAAGALRAGDGTPRGHSGGMLQALDAASYVMTLSILIRAAPGRVT